MMDISEAVVASLALAASVLLASRAVALPGTGPASVIRSEASLLKRFRTPLACLAGGAGWAFVGGVVGVVAGVVVALFAWRTLSKARSPSEIRRDARLRTDYPLVIELLAHVLAAGSDIQTALHVVGNAVGGPWETRLEDCLNALHIGQPPSEVWAELEDGALTCGLGRALARSSQTGVPVAKAMRALAHDAREESDLAAHAYARTIEVRAAAPLGVCFLPAFVLLGVVPLVAGILRSLAWATP